ncbi:NAD(P)-binding protein [Auricularia subglabra TFB-10046 SS5]|nr:NAD(P)-binding protein [Auricularia subglabra TFB-10046 SS5]
MSPTIIITGASRGIGLAATQFLLADGAHVVTVQRTISPELQALAGKYPTSLRNIQGDFSAEEIIKQSLKEALETFGAVDAAVFNAAAGSYSVTPVATLALADWQRTFDVNVFGVVRFLKDVLPVLKDGSRLVFVSSNASELGVAGIGPYSASKAALSSINRTVSAEHPGIVGIRSIPMQKDFASQAKGVLPEAVLDTLFEDALEPEVPGRVIADLALRAPASLSGKYLHWNDPALEGI